MKKTLFALLAAAAMAAPAAAEIVTEQTHSGPRWQVAKMLENRYNQTLQRVWVSAGQRVEVFVAPTGGVTVLMTDPTGHARTILTGHSASRTR